MELHVYENKLYIIDMSYISGADQQQNKGSCCKYCCYLFFGFFIIFAVVVYLLPSPIDPIAYKYMHVNSYIITLHPNTLTNVIHDHFMNLSQSKIAISN